MFLNHYLAQAGVCSRRKAVVLIKGGYIKVNGKTVKDPTYQVQQKDAVKCQNKLVRLEEKVYILLNKPTAFLSTTSDDRGRATILDLVPHARKKRLYPIGRLDKDTTGIIILTNDGELAQTLAHPKYEIKKVYEVTLDKPLMPIQLTKIRKGIRLRDGVARVDHITFPDRKLKNIVRISLHSGKKHVIRRIFDHLGNNVKKLDRINYAGLTKKGLRRGSCRPLSKDEIKKLKEPFSKPSSRTTAKQSKPVKTKKRSGRA